MKDIPHNSHFRVDLLLSMSSLLSSSGNPTVQWQRFGFSTYALLKENADVASFRRKLAALAKTIPINDQLQYAFVSEPLQNLYLQGSIRGNKAGSTSSGNPINIYIFSFVAFFVLCIACFNYINLTTALSLKRAKEVGIRQVLGASKKQLVTQFFMDALLLSLLAFLISIGLCALAAPYFNLLVGKVVIASIQDFTAHLPHALVIALITGLLSGIYPAFFLSGFKPVSTLKGKFTHSTSSLALRRSLVVAQFVVFTLLAVTTIVVYRQLHFMRNENLGFNKAHNLIIDFHYDKRIGNHAENVKTELTGIAGIDRASFSAYVPGRPNRKFATVIEGQNNEQQKFHSDVYFIDEEFLELYGIEIIAGRGFSKSFSNDLRESMLINEACLKRLGYHHPQDAIGKRFAQRSGTGEIIGVVKDFHFHSMREEIKPLTLQVAPGFFTFLTLTISSNDVPATLKALEKKWHLIVPGLPLVYYFSDETFHAQYQAEERFGRVFVTFAVFSIFIASLGLLGLVSFNTVQRTKEIGIRKVLGASKAQIFGLLTKEYFLLVILAFLLATPITLFAMHQWLHTFAYRIDLQWWMFLLAGASAIAIALFTVGFLAFNAILANPVESLRDE